MLASHSRIVIPPETWFLLPLVESLPIDRVLTGEEMDRAISIMTGHYRWPDMKIDADDFTARVHRLAACSVKDLAQMVYGTYLDATGKKRWGDKTPPYVRIVPQLAAIFPGARFIYLVRDGRDVARSFQSLMIYGPTLHQNTIEWRVANRWQRKWARSQYSSAMMQVQYEHLVVDPEITLRGICQFIGEAFEPAMLAWQDSVEDLVPTRELHVHQKLKRRSNREDIERWKREMTYREILVAEAFMGRDLRRLGYERRFESSLWRPLLWFTRAYCSFIWRLLPASAVRLVTRMLGREPGVQVSRPPESAEVRSDSATSGDSKSLAPGAVDTSRRWWRRVFRGS